MIEQRRGDILRERYSRRLEEEYLGKIDIKSAAYKRALERVGQPSEKSEFLYYVTRENALDLARNFQPFDPEQPDVELLRELRLAVLEKLEGYFGEFDAGKIKAYTAVDSPADILHGIDAFFDIGDQTITLDLTIQKDKKFVKADILIKEIPNPKDPANEDEFLKMVDEIASEIFRKLNKDALEESREKVA